MLSPVEWSTPRFQVTETFALSDKGTFVLAGFVHGGEIKAGMRVCVPFNSMVMLKVEIRRIEIVRRPDGDVVCLYIDCSAPDEVTLWEALKIRNRMIDVVPA